MKNRSLALLAALLLCTTGLFAQSLPDSFPAQWKLIDSLLFQKSLPKSALEQVNKLYKTASLQKNETQLIKLLIYKLHITREITENNDSTQLAFIRQEIAKSRSVPQKSILQLMLAREYTRIWQNNRWQIRSRTNTTVVPSDVSTWATHNFQVTTDSLYQVALAPASTLQQTTLPFYNAIIVKSNTRYLRPTLYDLLANDAIEFYNQTYTETESTPALSLPEAAALLAPAEDFTQYTFSGSGINVTQRVAVLYQQLLRLHSQDEKKDALIDADINRIEWAYTKSNHPQKDSLYLATLKQLIAKYDDNATAAQASYLHALYYTKQAALYKPLTDTQHRYDNVIAKNIIDRQLSRGQAASEGRSNMQNLLNNILAPSITNQAEAVNLPKQPFRVLVNYKNVPLLYGRIYRYSAINDSIPNSGLYYDSSFYQDFISQAPYQQFIQPLPVTNDYQTHSTEIKINALPVGRYLLVTSSNSTFSRQQNITTAITLITVSGIAYVKHDSDFFVLNRETGQPLAGIKAVFKENEWNSKLKKYEKKLSTFTSDKEGHFAYNGSYQRPTFYGTSDTLLTSDQGYLSYSDNSTSSLSVYFFTDRSIYRPGQTVYFKGIAVNQNRNPQTANAHALKDSLKIYLYNASYSEVDSLMVSTNGFGSFSGKFVLPQEALTGRFTIKGGPGKKGTDYQEYGQTSIQVEEYKRPKFYLAFDTLPGTYQLNDSITVTGHAKAYSGSTVNNANVTYTVTRGATYPYSWLFKSIYPPQGREQIIASGTVTTLADGSFTVKFAATPDSSVKASSHPLFNYNIEVAVTDISGETRQGSTQFSASYHSMKIKLDLPSVQESSRFTHIPVQVQNLSGKNIAAAVRIKMTPLESPSRLIRERYWSAPDQFVMNKQEYLKYFPNDEYGEESSPAMWPEKATVINEIYTTPATDVEVTKGGGYTLPRAVQEGWYKVEASIIDGQDTLKDVAYIQILNNKQNSLLTPLYMWAHASSTTLTAGDTLQLLTGTSAEKMHIIEYTVRGVKDEGRYSHYNLNSGETTTTIPITENDRGGISIHKVSIYQNRVYSHMHNIEVPYDNKELRISYKTFRNKTEPGSKETWSIQVSGSKGNKVATELLTAMYDASLDQFTSHDWSVPGIWPSYKHGYNPWQYGNSFRNNSSQNIWQDYSAAQYNKTYEYIATDAYVLGESITITEDEVSTFAGNAMNQVAFSAGRVAPAASAGSRKASRAVADITFKSEERMANLKQSVQSTDMMAAAPLAVAEANASKTGNIQPFAQPRTNFTETAFFFPQLHADTSGTYTFSFTMPESLTQWRWLTLAHSKDLAFGINEETVTTQKTLMAQLNAPRFLRQGDQVTLTATISNLDTAAMNGNIHLELMDAFTNQPVNSELANTNNTQTFTVNAGLNTAIGFPVSIPAGFNHPLTWRITASAGNYSDGEENTLPVLANRTLVTETIPLILKGNTTKQYTLGKLVNNQSSTLTTESVTVEYTSNPIWQAIQALPYLAEFPYECAEQTFNRFYANALAAFIVNKHPQIKTAFELWKKDSTANTAKLLQNENLKQILLTETPWVLQAESETQQRKNLAQLFDVVKMSAGAESALQKLEQMQLPEGSFGWFKGGYADRYITTYIVTGLGRLLKLNAAPAGYKARMKAIANNAIEWLDKKVSEEYSIYSRRPQTGAWLLSGTNIQYLFARSYFTEVPGINKAANTVLLKQARQYWTKQSNYNKALLAVILYRNEQKTFGTGTILPSILENAVEDSIKGMYWKDRTTCFWYASPIEHQATIMMAAAELSNNFSAPALTNAYDNMRTWLLLNKQTNHWGTTIATADACYALLLKPDYIQSSRQVVIQLGNKQISSTDATQQAGSGYFKERIDGAVVTPDMGNITVTTKSTIDPTNKTALSYGAVYWQYFENMDKITAATGNPLSVTKQWFISKTENNNTELVPVTGSSTVKVGDKLVVQLVIKSDRDMDYVHVKDMRAASMEPVHVLSGYKWQDALGYYEATKDASTSFFIDHLRKGTYVLNYPVYITNTGTFSGGIATAQCMYAPEFTSHSEGLKLTVK